MIIGVGLTELPEGCVPGGLYSVFNAQQMKLITDYLFLRSTVTRMYGGAENARLENAGQELSGTGNVWNATCGIT